MICFLGSSHAASHLRAAAKKRGNWLINDPDKAHVVFISEDTPTDEYGNRDLEPILKLIERAKQSSAQLVLTSQVPPGFTRSIGIKTIFHQAETLRIKDAANRAHNPEYIAVGGDNHIGKGYADYLASFQCPIIRMTWEEAEFSKIAVNMFLAAQVDTTNRLSAAASKVGAKWDAVAEVLRSDSRIGERAYLTPGRWEDSKHLLRDAITLKGIECTVATT